MDNSKFSTNLRLLRLKTFLNYEIPGLGVGSYFVIIFGGIFLYIIILAAIVFTPYMLYVLSKENKKGWIIAFAVIVIVPLLLSIIITALDPVLKLLLFIPLALFFLYCFLLRFEVNNWVREYNSRQMYLLAKRQHEEETAAYFNNTPR